MRFVLTIELGNAAMESPRDVASALRTLAARIGADGSATIPLARGESGRIRDVNGNRVGAWHVEGEE